MSLVGRTTAWQEGRRDKRHFAMMPNGDVLKVLKEVIEKRKRQDSQFILEWAKGHAKQKDIDEGRSTVGKKRR